MVVVGEEANKFIPNNFIFQNTINTLITLPKIHYIILLHNLILFVKKKIL